MDKKENPLKTAILKLKVGDVHSIPKDEKIRTNAHNYARYFKIKIETQRNLLDATKLNVVRKA